MVIDIINFKVLLRCFLTIYLHCTLLTVYKIFFIFILKGDYDVVINDYEKAKSLFGKTEVQVFKKCKASVLL